MWLRNKQEMLSVNVYHVTQFKNGACEVAFNRRGWQPCHTANITDVFVRCGLGCGDIEQVCIATYV